MPLLPSLAQRCHRPEIMDQLDLAPERHCQALRGLERINWWSGSVRLLWRPILTQVQKSAGQRLRLLDVATGAGDLPLRLWRKGRRAGVELEIAGCDRSPYAVAYARRRAEACRADVHFFEWDVLHNGIPDHYDIVASSLFLHHLDEEQAVAVLKTMADEAQRFVLINDLVRSRTGYLLAYLGTRVLSASDVVHRDGPSSVEGAFTVSELVHLAERAGLAGVRVTRHWPCRMLLEWERS
jgi:2-polyprenyl-3-methyl-5-hydroxy-6-metoxy-1,4-benzoquinol methylase